MNVLILIKRVSQNRIRALLFKTLVRSIRQENLDKFLDLSDIDILDSRGGRNLTITKKTWHVFEETNPRQEIQGYQYKESGQVCSIVNAVTKATNLGREMPVLLVINYATRIIDSQKHYKSRFLEVHLPRQNESIASNIFFPSVKLDRGNTYLQFFWGINSNRWEVYSLKKEIAISIALQDYTRRVGCPPIIRIDNV